MKFCVLGPCPQIPPTPEPTPGPMTPPTPGPMTPTTPGPTQPPHSSRCRYNGYRYTTETRKCPYSFWTCEMQANGKYHVLQGWCFATGEGQTYFIDERQDCVHLSYDFCYDLTPSPPPRPPSPTPSPPVSNHICKYFNYRYSTSSGPCPQHYEQCVKQYSDGRWSVAHHYCGYLKGFNRRNMKCQWLAVCLSG